MPYKVEEVPLKTPDFNQIRWLLWQICANVQAKIIVETGTDVGDSTRIFSAFAEQTGGHVWTVDINGPKEGWENQWPVKNITFVKGDSKSTSWGGNPIDVVFLDAHGAGMDVYTHVKAELEKFGSFVRTGGKILAHDVYHSEFGKGITKALTEYSREKMVPLTFYPFDHGLAEITMTYPVPR